MPSPTAYCPERSLQELRPECLLLLDVTSQDDANELKFASKSILEVVLRKSTSAGKVGAPVDGNELTKSAKALLTVGKAKRRGEDALDTLEIEHLMEPLGLEMVWQANENWDTARRRHGWSVSASTIRPSQKTQFFLTWSRRQTYSDLRWHQNSGGASVLFKERSQVLALQLW